MPSERDNANGPPARARLGTPETGQTRWLDDCRIELAEDPRRRLILAVDGRRFEDVSASKVFALTDPDRFVSFRQADGAEIGILKDPSRLAGPSEALLRRRLAVRYFIPRVSRVLHISEFYIDQLWTVQTDRGQRRFTLQGRDAVRFLSDRAMLLVDVDNNRYLIEDRESLDAASRRWIDRYVW